MFARRSLTVAVKTTWKPRSGGALGRPWVLTVRGVSRLLLCNTRSRSSKPWSNRHQGGAATWEPHGASGLRLLAPSRAGCSGPAPWAVRRGLTASPPRGPLTSQQPPSPQVGKGGCGRLFARLGSKSVRGAHPEGEGCERKDSGPRASRTLRTSRHEMNSQPSGRAARTSVWA